LIVWSKQEEGSFVLYVYIASLTDILWARVSAKLKEDQDLVLHPDVDSPFVDEIDVINRLLPYHVFQQPKEDLSAVVSGKGKEKAAAIDWDDEIAGFDLSSTFLEFI